MEIGKYNVLRVSRGVDFGLYLADADGHEVLLPRRYVTDSMTIGSEIEVFVYIDSENRPVATTERPTAVVGDFVLMRVKAVNATGAFLDWGLVAKDLLVPFREQNPEFKLGEYYVVYVDIDNEGRLFGTTRFNRYFSDYLPENSDLKAGDRVDLMPVAKTPLGVRMVVNNSYFGMLPSHLALQNNVHYGVKLKGFIQSVRWLDMSSAAAGH